MPGVVNEVTPVPPASAVPPLAALYQSMVSPVPADAVRVTVPVPHLVKGPAPEAGDAGSGITVAVTVVLDDETHPLAMVLASA